MAMTQDHGPTAASCSCRSFRGAGAARCPALAGWRACVARRSRAFETHGLPTRRLEAWKYTDLRERLKEAFAPAAAVCADRDGSGGRRRARARWPRSTAARFVFVDGVYSAALSRPDLLGDTAELMALAPLLAKAPGWLEGKFAPGRLGRYDAVDRAQHRVHERRPAAQDQARIAPRPYRCMIVVGARRAPSRSRSTSRNIIAMEKGARLDLVEAFVALPGAASQRHRQRARPTSRSPTAPRCRTSNARPRASGATHLSSWSVKVGAGARYRGFPAHRGPRPSPATRSTSRWPAPARSSTFPARSSRAARSTAIRHSSSITRSPAAKAASCSRACSRIARAACSRARSSSRPRRREDRRQADGAGADAVGGCGVRQQAGARDLRRRRRLRPRLDRRGARSRLDVLLPLARHSRAGGARAADRGVHRRGDRQDRERSHQVERSAISRKAG